MKKIKVSHIEIDYLRVEDMSPILSYWHDTPKDFWTRHGVELNFPLSRKEHEQRLLKQVEEAPTSICIIVCQKQRIGMHTLTHFKKTNAIMHAHYWNADFRGKGLGPISYVKAMDWFINKNNFDKIIFQTPKANPGPNRVKEKLEIPIIKEVMFDAPIMVRPVEAWHSEVLKADLPKLYDRLDELYGSGGGIK